MIFNKNKFIILDRDGVINQDIGECVSLPEEWVPIPGSLEAIGKLKKAGWTIVVATNQAGIARQLYSDEMLANIHKKMQRLLKPFGGVIDAIFYCPHKHEDHCLCRKPQPGLLLQIAAHFSISLSGIYFVGDTLRDIEAAIAVNCQPVLVETGYGSKTKAALLDHPTLHLDHIPIFPNLYAFVESIV